jgi:error-prone DNA polymerase
MHLSYAELHCVSNFSFLRGASHPEELVERALALGYQGLALTDECSFAGSVRAHLALRDSREQVEAAQRFQLIHGTEIQLEDKEDNNAAPGPKLVLLATNRTGYGNLSELVTFARRAATKGKYRLTRADLEARHALLDGTLQIVVPPPSLGTAAEAFAVERDVRWLRELAQPVSTWIACELTRGPDDSAHLALLQAIAGRAGAPLTAAGDVHMHRRARKPLADALAAVRLKTPLAQCGTRLAPNAERHFRPLYRLARIYPPGLLLETSAIAERCAFSLDELRYEYPEEIVPAGHTPASWLRQVTYDGAASRYPDGLPERVRAIVEHELALIADLRYEPYFLTVHDIVRFARDQKILCQGRGSAANSAVCYCLGITEVDPARMSVLFERFISKERNEPPDIDVDFEHQRREEVMQYIYAKYGRDRAALTAALHTYRPRGALRDIGKALGLSLDQVDRLAKSMAWWDGRQIEPERVREAGFDPDNPLIAKIVALAHELIGFPRHLSQHSGGFVIARTQLSRLVPIENAAMADRTVIQWDKDDLDALGLLKIDVLALGMLSCVRRAFDHIERFGGTPLRMQDIPSEDERVYDMLCRGDSLGVFQVESRAQMNMLPRLRPRCYYDLVIETAIVRPGPIQGGMVHPYLRRRQGLEPVTYPSDAVRAVLERTLGVSIFQEQVMQLAVVAAGFTPGEADQLRRAMAAWKRKGGLGPFRDKLVAGMLARGYTAEYAEQIYRQIQGFGEYGFPESHAASFALLVYVSSWLKCHEPASFCAALLDSQPLGFYAPAQIVRDAVDHGVEVRPICVAASDWHCTLEPSSADPRRPAVRLGLELVSGFNEPAAQRLVAARAERPFTEVADLALRAQLARGEITRLAAADALAVLSGHRRRALWTTLGVDTAAPRSAPLTAPAPPREPVLDLPAPTEGEEIVADYAHTALTLRRHPLALLRTRLDALNLVTAATLVRSRNRQPIRIAGIVTCRQRPATASGVTFVTIEDETGTANVVVWRTTAERWRRELLGAQLLTVYGHVEREGDVIHVIAGRLVDHSKLLGGLMVGSRDFR